MQAQVKALLAAALIAFPQAASACAPPAPGTFAEVDAERFAGLETARLRGLSAALTADDLAARETVAGLYANGLAPAGEIAEGAYACRIVKLGGLAALVVYPFFECAITAREEGFDIVKTTGSQRFSGTLVPSGDGYLYAGALHYAYEEPIAYGGGDERDQVGCLKRVSAEGSSYVLELPFPPVESLHDIVVLVPRP